MHRAFRSSTLRIVMLGLLAPHLGACFNTVQIDPGTQVKPAKFVGVTTKAGDSLAFHPAGARLSHDTLYAVTDRGPFAIPTDSIRSVWVQQYSGGKTAALIVVGVLITAAALVALGSSVHPGYSP